MGRPEISAHISSQAFMQYYYLKEEMVSFLRDNHLPVSGSKEVLKRRIADFIDNAAAVTNVQPASEQAGAHDVPSAQNAALSVPTTLSASDVPDTPMLCGYASSVYGISVAEAPVQDVSDIPDASDSPMEYEHVRPVRTASVIGDDAPIGAGFVCSEAARAYFVSRLGRRFSFKVPFQKWLKNNPEATFSDACSAYKEIISADKDRRRHGLTTCIGPQFEYNAYIRAFFADNPGSTLADAIKCWNYKKSLPGPHSYAPGDAAVLENVTRDKV